MDKGIEALIAKMLEQTKRFDNVHITESEAKQLIAALEQAQRQNGYLREQSAEWERKAISNFEECSEMSVRIEELESQRKLAFAACNRWRDKCADAERRIAELEVSKLITFPENKGPSHGWIIDPAFTERVQVLAGERFGCEAGLEETEATLLSFAEIERIDRAAGGTAEGSD